jgi:hypothetical protein
MEDRTRADAARLQGQRDDRSAALDREVNAEIAARAERRDIAVAADAAEAERLATQAGKLDRLELDRSAAAAAAASAEASASARARGRAIERDQQVSVISRVVTYLFSLVYGLLLIRIVLALLAASPATPFVSLIHSMARPFHAPFDGIGASLTASPEGRLIIPMIVAILVGVLVHAAILGLLRLFAPREVITQT